MFLAETGVEWRSAGDLQRAGDKAVNQQKDAIRQLVAAAKAAGYPIPPLRLRIPVRVIDNRQKSSEPLPTFEDQRLDIN